MKQLQNSKLPPKPHLSKKQIAKIQWLNASTDKNFLRVGRYKNFWVISKQHPHAPVLIYNQNEWDAFIDGVKTHEFDDLVR